MKNSLPAHHRVNRTLIIGGIMVATIFSSGAYVSADSGIFKIEEDWELVVNDPDANNYSPQVTFFMSPRLSEYDYFQLQMNYSADADVDFTGGGFHVAAVRNGSMYDEARSQTRLAISSDNDHIRWTSVMANINGEYLFAVKNGYGDEWGPFGGPEYLVRMPAEGDKALNEYSPQASLDNVDIGFGANRVSSLKLLQVRYYFTDGHEVSVAINQSP